MADAWALANGETNGQVVLNSVISDTASGNFRIEFTVEVTATEFIFAVGGAGANNSGDILFFTSLTNLQVRRSGQASVNLTLPQSADAVLDYEVVSNTANGNIEFFQDGVSIGTVPTNNFWGLSGFFPFNTTAQRRGSLYRCKVYDSTDALIHDYNPTLSNGTGTTLTDSVGSNNGLLTNYSGDNSYWILYDDGTGGGPVTIEGTLSQTLSGATLSATGVLTNRGILNETLNDATLTSTAAVTIRGIANNTLGAATLDATASVTVRGALDVTLDDATLVATDNDGSAQYCLRYDGVNDTVRASGASIITDNIRFEWIGTIADFSQGDVGLFASDSDGSFLVWYDDPLGVTAVFFSGGSVRNDGITGLVADVEYKIVVEAVSEASLTVTVTRTSDDVVIGTQTESHSLNLVNFTGLYIGDGTNFPRKYIGDFSSLKVFHSDVIAHSWDASDSNGTGSSIPNSVSSADATLLNFTTDDSQWILKGPPANEGALDVTLGDATLDGIGAVTIRGVADNTLADATLDGIGAVTIRGVVDNTLADATLVGAGLVQTLNEGALDVTLDDATLDAVGVGELVENESDRSGVEPVKQIGDPDEDVVILTALAFLNTLQ